MTRNITDDLAEWVAKRKDPRRQDAQTVAFLAVRSDVVVALGAGYSVKTVWAFLKESGRITSSYETFRRHVQRHIRSSQKPSPMSPSPVASASPFPAPAPDKTESVEPKQPAAPTTGIGKFAFSAVPNKGELI